MTNWLAAINKIETLITGRKPTTKDTAMSDTPIVSPATSPSLPSALPLWAQPLAQRLRETKADDLAPVCEFFRVPLPSTYPSPGQARTWRKDEWSEWCKDNGYEFDSETSHSWLWRHKLASKLTVSVAKTPGDWRTPMAMATETRRAARTFAMMANATLRAFMDLNPANNEEAAKWFALDEDQWRTAMISKIQTPTERDAAAIDWIQSKLLAENAGDLSKSVGDVMNLINRIKDEFGHSSAKILTKILGSAEEADKQWQILKLCNPSDPQPNYIVEELRDYLTELRDIERAEKEMKRLEREQQEADRLARKAEKERPRTAAEITKGLIEKHRNAQAQQLHQSITAAQSLIDRLRAAERDLQKPVEIPEIVDAGLMDQIAEKDAQLAKLNETIVGLDAMVKRVEQERDEALGKITEPERMDKLCKIEHKFDSLTKTVIETVDLVRSANAFQMVELLASLQTEAREARSVLGVK